MPVKCSRCRRLNLPDCKVASKSKSCGHYIAAGRVAYLSYNVHGNDPSVLRKVLDEKKRLNAEECETALLLCDTASKLLRLKDQQKGLAQRANELFSYKFNIIVEEECEA